MLSFNKKAILYPSILFFLIFLPATLIFSAGNTLMLAFKIIFLFTVCLSLMFFSEFSPIAAKRVLIANYQNSKIKFDVLIYWMIAAFFLLFIGWIIIQAKPDPFVSAVSMLAFIALIGLLASRSLSRISIVSVVLCAIILRLIWSFVVLPQPQGDYSTYWFTSQKMFFGIAPFQTKSPLTILFYGVISYVFDKNLWGAYIVNSLVAGLQIWLIYKITMQIASNKLAAKISAIIYALYPTAIFFSAVVSSETIAITMVLASTYFLARKFNLDSSPKMDRRYHYENFLLLMAISLFAAAACMTRNSAIVFLYAVILSVCFFSSKKIIERLSEVLIIVMFFLAFMSPQIVSNYNHHGNLSIFSVNISGVVLLHGVNRPSDGRYDRAVTDRILTELGYTRKDLLNYKVINEVSNRAHDEAINNILSDKLGFAKFAMTKKFNRMWVNDDYSIMRVNGIQALNTHGKKSLSQKINTICAGYYLGLWLLAMFGILLACVKRNAAVCAMASYIILSFALHFFYEVTSRYHHIIMPFVCIIGAYVFSAIPAIPRRVGFRGFSGQTLETELA